MNYKRENFISNTDMKEIDKKDVHKFYVSNCKTQFVNSLKTKFSICLNLGLDKKDNKVTIITEIKKTVDWLGIVAPFFFEVNTKQEYDINSIVGKDSTMLKITGRTIIEQFIKDGFERVEK